MDFLYVDGVLDQGRVAMAVIAVLIPLVFGSYTAYALASDGDQIEEIATFTFVAVCIGIIIDLVIGLFIFIIPLWGTILIALFIAGPAVAILIGRWRRG